MKTLSRHKTFIKDMRTVRLTDIQATKLFLYVAQLLKNEPFTKPTYGQHYEPIYRARIANPIR